jgi:hypothetical protein
MFGEELILLFNCKSDGKTHLTEHAKSCPFLKRVCFSSFTGHFEWGKKVVL